MANATLLRTLDDLTLPLAGTYRVDAAHSSVECVVRHMGLAKVRARFDDFEGTIQVGERPEDSRVDASVRTASIDTRDEKRDAHLRGPDFLDAERYPTIELHSSRVHRVGKRWQADADLTICGVTRPVKLDVEFEGAAPDPWGNARIGCSATTEVNREDFGLTWNQVLETGGWLVGKEVRIEISVEAVRE
ncbi:MAG TPA: YceI family protein [Acidimicrobiales bacterium]|nr:YceI family protein [Acidimicrobiales bacterium]